MKQSSYKIAVIKNKLPSFEYNYASNNFKTNSFTSQMHLIGFMLTNSPFKFCSKNIKNQYQDFSERAQNSQHYQKKIFFGL